MTVTFKGSRRFQSIMEQIYRNSRGGIKDVRIFRHHPSSLGPEPESYEWLGVVYARCQPSPKRLDTYFLGWVKLTSEI